MNVTVMTKIVSRVLSMSVVSARITTDEWMKHLGEQFRRRRLLNDMDQEYTASLAGVSVGALKNLESGKGASVRTLVSVARVLNATEWLLALQPAISVSPIDIMRRSNSRRFRPRQRAYKPRKACKE